MRRTALLAAVVGGFMASSSFGALQVYLNGVDMSPINSAPALPGTSTGTVPAGAQVYLISVRDDANATTAVSAASLTGTVLNGSGKFYFPFGDTSGGVGSTAAPANITKRSNPDGTFFFLPAATATVGTNLDPGSNGAFPDAEETSGSSTGFSIQTFRSSGAYTTTAANGIVLGAVVVSPGTTFELAGVVNATLDSVNNVPFAYAIPEPATLSAVGLAALGLVRRRK